MPIVHFSVNRQKFDQLNGDIFTEAIIDVCLEVLNTGGMEPKHLTVQELDQHWFPPEYDVHIVVYVKPGAVPQDHYASREDALKARQKDLADVFTNYFSAIRPISESFGVVVCLTERPLYNSTIRINQQ